MKTLLNIAAAAALTGLCAQPAVAQSIYGCTDLEGRHAFASVEGDGGVFYRVDPDLRMFHPLSDETVDQLARLSEALASLGTTLVYVPLPTKSLAMPDQLPQKARDFGFDASVATTVYGDAIKRLREKGVAAADVRRALRAGVDEPLSFYQTDYRLTSAGARRAARAIADTMGLAPGFVDLPKGRFDTRSTGMVAVPSDMRAALQRHCQRR